MADKPRAEKVGPGTLTLGETGSDMDISCQVSAVTLEPDKDEDDPINLLCGESVSGAIEYSWKLNATILQDWSSEGINKWSLDNAGETVEFEFSPRTDGPVITGELVVDPLAIGGDVGSKPNSEVEWNLVGSPTWDDDGDGDGDD